MKGMKDWGNTGIRDNGNKGLRIERMKSEGNKGLKEWAGVTLQIKKWVKKIIDK